MIFGVSPSPFLLAATIRHHIQQKESQQPKAEMCESLYVDDFIVSSCEVDEVYTISTAGRDILFDAGMKLCEWVTNLPELRARWAGSAMEQNLVSDSSVNILIL